MTRLEVNFERLAVASMVTALLDPENEGAAVF
jgi:hypothetical protein